MKSSIRSKLTGASPSWFRWSKGGPSRPQISRGGPLFDPGEVGLESHAVFLTDRETIFVFETEQGVKALERILNEPEFWDVVSPWEHCMAEEPRLAAAVFEW